MAIVNYVRESRAFIRYASDNSVTGNERLLWYALFEEFNDRAQGVNWPDGFISISNRRLLSWLPFSEDSLIKARNRLAQRGIIKYKPGQKNTQNPMYRLLYFSTVTQSYPQDTESNPQIAGNTQGNMQGNQQGNMPGNVPGNMPGINVNLNVAQNVASNGASHTYCNDDAWRTSARVRYAVAQRILDGYQGDKTFGSDVHWDIVEYLEKGMTPDRIASVLEDCAEARYIPMHLHTEALAMGIDAESDAPPGY